MMTKEYNAKILQAPLLGKCQWTSADDVGMLSKRTNEHQNKRGDDEKSKKRYQEVYEAHFGDFPSSPHSVLLPSPKRIARAAILRVRTVSTLTTAEA